MRSINPEMEEPVRILGGSRLLAIRKVLAPLLKRSLAGAWILVFIPATRELSSAIFLVGPNTRVISVMLFDLSEEGQFRGALRARHDPAGRNADHCGDRLQAHRPRLHGALVMSKLRLRGIEKRYGEVPAVAGLDLDLQQGEFVSLLGPSGCGKTTTLAHDRGLHRSDRRHDRDGRQMLSSPVRRVAAGEAADVDDLPELRGLAEHDGGAERRVRAGAAQAAARGGPPRVAEMLEVVHMSHLAARYPAELSGGQQQRVALARAIVIQPQVLLLDEPLSNLDANLREEMRFEIRRLHDEFRITTVYVTHDQAEAMVTSDRIAVMNQGRIEQVADPHTLYNRPKTRFVAGFIGRTNFIEGTAGRRSRVRPFACCRCARGRAGVRQGDRFGAAAEHAALARAVRQRRAAGRRSRSRSAPISASSGTMW
jgi:iron(III) transport system ATP-binding protein